MAQAKKKRNLFGFGKQTTHSTRIVADAYAAGRRSGDTSEFRGWWGKQFSSGPGKSGFSPKPSKTLRRRAEARYRAGVESLWHDESKPKPSTGRSSSPTVSGSNQVQDDAISGLVNLGLSRAEATRRVKAAYRPGDTLSDMIRKTSARNSKKKRNAPDVLGNRIDKLLRDIYAMQGPMQTERLMQGKTSKYRRMSKLYMKRIRLLEKLQKEYRQREGIENPKKYDRCVAEVAASLKKAGRPGNAHAICTAAGTRNGKRSKNAGLVDMIRPGDRVTIVTPHGQQRTGRAVMRSSHGGWVLNLGGPYGTPGIADERNIIKVSKRKGNPEPPTGRSVGQRWYYAYRARKGGKWRTLFATSTIKSIAGNKITFTDGRTIHVLDIQGGEGLVSPRPPERSNPKTSSKNPTGHIRQGSAEATIEKTGGKYLVTIKSFGKAVLRKPFASLKAALAHARINVQRVAANPDPAIDLIPGGSTVAAYGKAGHRVLKGVTKLGKQTLKKLKGFATGKRRRNPIELAQQRVEEFTGFPSTEIMELAPRKHIHENLAGLAQFVAFNLVDADGKELPPLMAPGMKYTGDPKEILFSFKGEPKGDWDFDARTPADKIVWLTSSEKTDYKIDGKPVQVKQQLFLSGGDQSLDEKGMRYLRLEPRDLHDNTFVGTIVRVWYWTRKTFEAKGKEKVWFFHDFGKEGSMGRCPILIYHPLDPGFEIAGGRYYVALPRKDLKGVRGGPVSPGIVG